VTSDTHEQCLGAHDAVVEAQAGCGTVLDYDERGRLMGAGLTAIVSDEPAMSLEVHQVEGADEAPSTPVAARKLSPDSDYGEYGYAAAHTTSDSDIKRERTAAVARREAAAATEARQLA